MKNAQITTLASLFSFVRVGLGDMPIFFHIIQHKSAGVFFKPKKTEHKTFRNLVRKKCSVFADLQYYMVYLLYAKKNFMDIRVYIVYYLIKMYTFNFDVN